jgi:hypothetical protein
MGKGKSNFKPSKAPRSGQHIRPHLVEAKGSTNHLHPIFNLAHLGGDYCLSKCDDDEKAAFADTLHKLSKLPWREIQQSHRHGVGHETLPRYKFGDRVFPPVVTDDVTILAFRFSGTKSMVGFRKDQVFVVLYLDRDYSLYDHGS